MSLIWKVTDAVLSVTKRNCHNDSYVFWGVFEMRKTSFFIFTHTHTHKSVADEQVLMPFTSKFLIKDPSSRLDYPFACRESAPQ